MIYTRIDFQIKEPRPYPFIGGTLRGALGYALKKLEKNPRHQYSLFNSMFLKENAAPDYRLAFDMEDEKFSFSIYLFNSLIEKAHDIVKGFKFAIEIEGLGRDRIAYTIDNIIVNNKEFDTSAPPMLLNPIATDKVYDVELFFQTPLRINQDGKIVTKDLQLQTILSSTYRKLCELSNETITPLSFLPSFNLKHKFLRFENVERTSTRQKQKITLGGVVGVMSLSDVDSKTISLLEVAEVIGAGKNNTVGLGTIKLDKKELD